MVRLPTASMITQGRDGTEANPPRFGTASLIIGRMDRPAGALRVGRSRSRGEPPFATRSQCWPEAPPQLSFQAAFFQACKKFL